MVAAARAVRFLRALLTSSSLISLFLRRLTMGVLRDQMIRELRLRRYAPATQKAYLEAVVGLTKHFRISPDQLSARQVQDYLLYLMMERKLHWNSVNAICSGLMFFYSQTLKRSDVARAMPLRRTPRQLPEILSGEELIALFAAADNLQHRALLMTTYGGGLRVSEVIKLRPNDIDSQRMMIRVVAGKRAKDRYTLLSVRLLEELRAYWRAYRPGTWLFPARRPETHFNDDKAREVFNQAKAKAGIRKAGSIHLLRHCFATHLLEAGVDLRTIQIVMGHSSIQSTVWYLHLTRKKVDATQNPLDLLDLSALAKPEVPPCPPS
jgi:integrase/recombinase XerD